MQKAEATGQAQRQQASSMGVTPGTTAKAIATSGHGTFGGIRG